MNQPVPINMRSNIQDDVILPRVFVTAVVLYLVAVAVVYLQWRPILAYAALAGPLGFIVATQPRLALYQYLFCLYIHYFVIESIPLLLSDLSAALLIMAAAVDLLTDNSLPKRLPRLSFNFVALLAALVVAAVFGHDMTASFRPLARISLLFMTFLALYRLTGRVGVGHLLRLAFWLAVGHSILVVMPFIASGGMLRSFGFSGKVFDELTMFAVPIGLSLYLFSERGKGGKYLLGSLVTLLGLLATQSRAPIMFAALALIVVLFLARRKGRSTAGAIDAGGDIQKDIPATRRVYRLLLAGVVVAPLIVLMTPGVLTALIGRFERLMTLEPGGTFALRMVLWKTALTAFWDNPITGVGPGLFRSLSDFYPTLHLTPVYYYVRNLSAHNLFLHYLAESGLIGATALMALFVNQFRLGVVGWRTAIPRHFGQATALMGVSFLFLISTLIESGWMWGQLGFIMVFYLSLLVRSVATKPGES